MYCTACSAELVPSATYCHACGKAAAGPPAARPGDERLARHIRLLGILWLVLSGMRLLPGLLLIAFSGSLPFFPDGMPGFLPTLLAVVGGFLSLAGIAGIVTGWGLLARETWARTLAIVVACLNLLDLPFGTALGVYTLWVLLSGDAEREYQRISGAGVAVAG